MTYYSEMARRLWEKACNFHRGRDPTHVCGNPAACERRFREADAAERRWISFQKTWK